MFSSAGGTRTDNTSVRTRTCYQLSHPGSPGGSHNPGSSTGGGGGLLPTGGIVGKEQPRHEKAIPMGPCNVSCCVYILLYRNIKKCVIFCAFRKRKTYTPE